MITSAELSHAWEKRWWLPERFLLLIDALMEFCAVLVLGALVGWLIGLGVGRIYVAHYRPVYLSQVSSWSEISEWSLKPFAIAVSSAYIGTVVATVFALISRMRTHFRK